MSHKQNGHVSTPYGISNHSYWLHQKDLDQQCNRSGFLFSLIRLLSLSVYIINKTGSAENKVKSL